jgi:hypothetical protein
MTNIAFMYAAVLAPVLVVIATILVAVFCLRDARPDRRAPAEQTQNAPKKNKQHKRNGTMKNTIRLIVTCGTVIILIKVMIVLIRYLPPLLESYLSK